VKIKIWIAYSLLLSFFVLVTPRTLWHECEHTTHSHSTNSKDPHSLNHIEKKSCFACDFDLGFVDQPGSVLSFAFEKFFPKSIEKPFITAYKTELPHFSERGPPRI
jgi:hypothetical protein